MIFHLIEVGLNEINWNLAEVKGKTAKGGPANHEKRTKTTTTNQISFNFSKSTAKFKGKQNL
jgi:hypothetical protein